MAELKKCPFCGREAKVKHFEDYNMDFSSTYKHYVICLSCKANTDLKGSLKDAEEAWNNRVTESEIRAKAIDEMVERIKIHVKVVGTTYLEDIDEIAEQLKEE